MSRIVVALSGRVAAGKSTLAGGLQRKYGAHVFSTRQALQRRYEAEHASEALVERAGLQNYGEHLDEATGGRWLAEEVQPMLDRQAPGGLLVIDAVRTSDQLEVLRQVFGRKVWHVHVESDPHALAHRYQERRQGQVDLEEFSDYADVGRNRTEAKVPQLEALADVVLNTQRNSPTDVLTRCAARLGLLPDLGDDLVDVLVGGEFGSEGKGNVAFYLASEYDVLMRVGGPNAGHVVPTEPQFTHRSLPSGSLANPHALLLIGPGAVLNADVLLDEIRDSRIEPSRLRIDPQAMLITAADIKEEAALKGSIGSTGQGVGQAAARRILSRGDDDAESVLAGASRDLQPFIEPSYDILQDAYSRGQRVLLEGTQGTGLSLYHGTYPYVTSRDTTVAGVLSEAGISPRRVRRSVVVCRTYPIRVGGRSGPIGSSPEITWDDIAERSGLSRVRIDERGSVSGNERRVAEFDWALLRRSAELNGATDVALTFADYLDAANSRAYRYDQLTQDTIRFVEDVEQVAGAPVSLISTDFSRRSVIDRRDWRGRALN